eukprot:scaffold638_cov382-Prasinococcus_capsulatus_cf.AAC.1
MRPGCPPYWHPNIHQPVVCIDNPRLRAASSTYPVPGGTPLPTPTLFSGEGMRGLHHAHRLRLHDGQADGRSLAASGRARGCLRRARSRPRVSKRRLAQGRGAAGAAAEPQYKGAEGAATPRAERQRALAAGACGFVLDTGLDMQHSARLLDHISR